MKKNYRVLLFGSLIALASISTVTYAGAKASQGFYIGADAVGGQYNPIAGSAFINNLVPVDTFIRPYIGYRFNESLAAEAGFDDIVNDSNHDQNGPDHYKLYAIDIAGKFIYPFATGFSLFAKAGAAYTHQDVYNEWILPSGDSFVYANSKVNAFLPLLGVGVSYNFTPQVATQLSATHLEGNSGINNINMIGLGLNYTF